MASGGTNRWPVVWPPPTLPSGWWPTPKLDCLRLDRSSRQAFDQAMRMCPLSPEGTLPHPGAVSATPAALFRSRPSPADALSRKARITLQLPVDPTSGDNSKPLQPSHRRVDSELNRTFVAFTPTGRALILPDFWFRFVWGGSVSEQVLPYRRRPAAGVFG